MLQLMGDRPAGYTQCILTAVIPHECPRVFQLQSPNRTYSSSFCTANSKAPTLPKMPINASTCMYVWNLAMEKRTLVETRCCKLITIYKMKYSVCSCHHCNVYSPTTFSTEQQMDPHSNTTTTSCCTLRHIMFKHHKGQSDSGNLVMWAWTEYMVDSRTGNMIFCVWVMVVLAL